MRRALLFAALLSVAVPAQAQMLPYIIGRNTITASIGPANCPRGQVYPDGCTLSPLGTAQYSSLLSGYSFRPPWNAAGVDYPVGIPTALQSTLTDWTAFIHTGCSVVNNFVQGQPTTHAWIRCDNQSNLDINNIDFSLHGGAQLFCVNCTNTIVENSKTGGANAPYLPNALIVMSGTSSGLIVRNNELDGGASGPGLTGTGQATLISASNGNITLQYNWFKHYTQQVLETAIPAGANECVNIQYNLYDDAYIESGGHQNYVQTNQGTLTCFNDQFNTTYQATLGGAEGFQNDSIGNTTQNNPTLSNNTGIAVKSGGSNTMSYWAHGPYVSGGAGGVVTVTGTATVSNNYLDMTGATGAFYPSSWSSANVKTGNVNMNDGSTINP